MLQLTVASRSQTLNNERVIDPLVRGRVTALRERKGWTQAYLAEQAGVATNTVGGLEGGRQTRWKQFEDIARALGVTTHALQTGDGLTEDNPLVKKLRLTDEALRIAKKFQEAETDLRLIVAQLLKLGTRDPMVLHWHRVQGLSAHRRETLLLSLAEHEKLQAEERAKAAGKLKPKKS